MFYHTAYTPGWVVLDSSMLHTRNGNSVRCAEFLLSVSRQTRRSGSTAQKPLMRSLAFLHWTRPVARLHQV